MEEPMTNPFEDENGEYFVVVNDEEQYSIWPTFREVPAGWTAIGDPRPRQECLDFIERTWTDMRPKSLREQMERDAAERSARRVATPTKTSQEL